MSYVDGFVVPAPKAKRYSISQSIRVWMQPSGERGTIEQ
jgi:uncharacterized protein YbaA (DUF1428 family)